MDKKELESILLSHFVTSSRGGRRYLPFAFTEQGIYMLMTELIKYIVKRSRLDKILSTEGNVKPPCLKR